MIAIRDYIPLSENAAYNFNLKMWRLVEDCAQGQQQIKARGDTYLPRPNPTDRSEENLERYQQYLDRAIFYNTVYKTMIAMVGVVFRQPPKVELPSSIEYIIKNADGAGLSINQQAQSTFSEVLKKGRCGLLVDHPPTVDGTTRADVAMGVRATIKQYKPEYILDWNEEETPSGSRLNYVKIVESNRTVDIETGAQSVEWEFITLRLIDGVYSIERSNAEGVNIGERIEPRRANGKTFNFIPFIFPGSENNSPDIDQVPMYDLAVVNIGHYRNSADNEEASFIAGQPTLAVTSSLSASEFNESNPSGVMIGSRYGHFLGESGSLVLVQASPNNLPSALMKDKEEQMVSLGAQLVSQTGNETAFAVGAKLASNTSALSLIAGNVSDAYAKCFAWCLEFMSTTESTEDMLYELNKDFFPPDIDAQLITAWVGGVQGGILPQSALNDMLRSARVTALTDEEIEVETKTKTDGGLDLG